MTTLTSACVSGSFPSPAATRSSKFQQQRWWSGTKLGVAKAQVEEEYSKRRDRVLRGGGGGGDDRGVWGGRWETAAGANRCRTGEAASAIPRQWNPQLLYPTRTCHCSQHGLWTLLWYGISHLTCFYLTCEWHIALVVSASVSHMGASRIGPSYVEFSWFSSSSHIAKTC